MFVNILRISASNVLKMLRKINFGIGCAGVIFHSYKPTGRTRTFINPRTTKLFTKGAGGGTPVGFPNGCT